MKDWHDVRELVAMLIYSVNVAAIQHEMRNEKLSIGVITPIQFDDYSIYDFSLEITKNR